MITLNYLIEYMKLHIISLEQDLERIDYTELHLHRVKQAEIDTARHLLSVADDRMTVMNTTKLEPHLQKQIDYGSSGTDVLHGELKNLMLEAEIQLGLAQRSEDESGEAMDSMVRTYWEGVLEALTNVYKLTYALAFAIDERAKKNG